MVEPDSETLLEFDPEIERTFLKRRRELRESGSEVDQDQELLSTEQNFREELPVGEQVNSEEDKMGDQRSLRELWIPQDENMVTEMAPPVIQASNFEIKPALITMVQHKQFSGSPDPHEHIRKFLEYCNTLKHNGVTPEAIRMQLFHFLSEMELSNGYMLCQLA